MSPSSLSPLAQREVTKALERLRGEGRSARSWGDLVSSWRTFVSAVARGYRDSIYDYTNDLSARDRLADVLNGISVEARAAVEPDVVRIDAQFVAATRASSVPVPGGGDDPQWWWWRIPQRLEADLQADLAAERVTEELDG